MRVSAGRWRRRFQAALNARALATLIALAGSPIVTTGASSRPVTEAEKASLGDTVREFDKAISAADYERVVALSLPPRMIALLATKGGVQTEFLREAVVKETSKAMAAVKLDRSSMDFAGASYKELANGDPYATLATETIIAVPDIGRVRAKNDTIAIIDGGRWYLVRISEPQQVTIFREAYPEFAAVEFAKGTMEIVKE